MEEPIFIKNFQPSNHKLFGHCSDKVWDGMVKELLQAIDIAIISRSMASIVAMERHLWLKLMGIKEKKYFS